MDCIKIIAIIVVAAVAVAALCFLVYRALCEAAMDDNIIDED